MTRTPVKASIFGTLALLHAEEGSLVDSGDRICEIEAMKVFYSQHSPAKGVLRWRIGLGQVLNTGEVIAWVESTP